MKKIFFILFLILLLISCSKKEIKEYQKMILKSEVLKENEMIPLNYICDGEDISPPLKWESIPKRTQSFCLIMDDPDAPGGTFYHWVIFNIPNNYSSLPENFNEISSFIKPSSFSFYIFILLKRYRKYNNIY